MLKEIKQFIKDILDCILGYCWSLQKCPHCKHIKITFLHILDGDEGYVCNSCWDKWGK